jgi:hypothetical protein
MKARMSTGIFEQDIRPQLDDVDDGYPGGGEFSFRLGVGEVNHILVQRVYRRNLAYFVNAPSNCQERESSSGF